MIGKREAHVACLLVMIAAGTSYLRDVYVALATRKGGPDASWSERTNIDAIAAVAIN